ncbi:ABC transporter ATP-binding protein [Pandoraea cepalis]|uniref:ABC transporter ATP-binding protein n=1 Tax=Pandoraea cepalis TaxID=2508294 RepID=UPI00263B9A5C|nr:ABC transporter ATP-binding protein [Pandoraea cepalis]
MQVSGLTAGYGRIQALFGVEFSVGAGQLVTLVGANGAGKTTLLRTLSGVVSATSGVVQLYGEDVTRVRADKRVARGMAHVPEGRQVFSGLTVEENLMLGGFTVSGAQRTEGMARVYDIFPVLFEKRQQLAGTLSGGQQQMLAIGRGLMSRPRLMLLDEPSMGLSPKLVQEVFDVIVRLRESGIPILLVEQNAHAALSIADYGYVMELGKIVVSGTGAELLGDDRVKQAYLGM